jgi:hypothetical protein
MKALINRIDSETLQLQTYTTQDLNAIPSEVVDSFWGNDGSKGEYAECTIISFDQTFQITDQSFQGLTTAGYTSATGIAYNVSVDPEKTLTNKGFTGGNYNIIYRFLRNELSSSSDTRPYFIKEISGDRTELRVATNFVSNDDLLQLVTEFKNRPNSGYFQDFYLNFGSNNLVIANNVLIDNSKEKYDLLINLYEPLPSRFILREPLWIVTQPADPLAFNVQFQPEIVTPKIFNATIKSANFNIPVKDKTNNSTQLINYEQLITSSLVSSYQQINSYLADKGINISIDYSNFENFIHFSSAKSRIENFVYKIQLIRQYKNDVRTLELAASTPLVESNILYLNNKIDDIIKNLDGFEYYLYFESGSTSYPKVTSIPPYTLRPWGSPQADTWYSSSIESASFYDENNKDYLINTIPDYLKEDPQNDPYKIFVDMMGQHYDNIWIYYKDVSNRYNGDNRLNHGISKDLVADAIKSFGLNVYQNNFSSIDLFNAFIGYNPDNKLRAVNSPIVNDYRSVSQEALNIPLDDVNKEMYKRIYHNLPYLLKSKGTVAGLQNIISMFGIPNTVLTIREFGGRYSGPTTPSFGGLSVTGIRDITFDNIEIYPSLEMDENNKTYSTMVPIVTEDGNNTYKPLVLSTVKSTFQESWYNYNLKRSLAPSVNTIEIAFSPQNDVDTYIENSSTFDIGTYIANPIYDFNNYSSYYSGLPSTILSSNTYNLSNYLNVIKQFDNSLFLMIKDFIPAKTNLKSGIVIKQHLLNRSKHDAPRAYVDSSSYIGTSSPSGQVEAGTGGSFNFRAFSNIKSGVLVDSNVDQFWFEQIPTPLGYTGSFHGDKAEFYNGELPYQPVIITTGEANKNNKIKINPTFLGFQVVNSAIPSSSFLSGGNPGSNTIALWFDATELTFNTPNILLPPDFGPTLGVINSPNSVLTSTVPSVLPLTTDTGGSSGGGSGGTSIGGTGRTTRNTTPDAPTTFR